MPENYLSGIQTARPEVVLIIVVLELEAEPGYLVVSYVDRLRACENFTRYPGLAFLTVMGQDEQGADWVLRRFSRKKNTLQRNYFASAPDLRKPIGFSVKCIRAKARRKLSSSHLQCKSEIQGNDGRFNISTLDESVHHSVDNYRQK